MSESRPGCRVLLLGGGLAVAYWLIETYADFLFGEGTIAARLFPSDPNEIWMRLIIVALILAFTGYISRAVDRRARTERRLRVLQSAVHQTDEAVLVTTTELDPPGPEIVYVNGAFCRLYGYAAEELLGETPRMLQGPGSEREVLDQLRRRLQHEQRFAGALTNHRKDGSSLRVELRISPVYDSSGELTHWISIQQDITERERVKATLKEGEEYFRATFEKAAIGVAHAGLDGRWLRVNEKFCQIVGHAREELLKKTFEDITHPDDLEADLEQRRRLLAGETGTFSMEKRYTRKDGSVVWTNLTGSLVRDPAGEPKYFISVVEDISRRRRAEAALKESGERFRALVQNSSDTTLILDADGTILYESPAVKRVLGFSPEERVGTNAFEYMHPEDEERVSAVFGSVLKDPGAQASMEYRVRNKRGVWRHLEAIGANLLEDPSIKGIVVNARDITERKRAEKALQESEERYRAVVEQAAEGIYLSDATTKRIVETNPSLQQMLGYTAEELRGMQLYELAARPWEEVDSNLRRTLKEKRSLFGDAKCRRKDGTILDVEIGVSVIYYGGREMICAVVRDITERKRTESALREVREAERRQIARDLHDEVLQELMDALYSMQITRIKLRDEQIDVPEIDEQIDDLRKATDSLRGAINNLRRESIREQPFLRLLRSVVVANRQKAPHIEVDLDVDVSFSSEPWGRAGIELLRIIQEALVNVRRHAWAHHVRVSLREEEDLLAAEVVDDGRGFDPQTTWGGVGLSAMQERAFKLDGDLDIQSEPGKGTRVMVRVPAASALAAGISHGSSKIREFSQP